MPRFRGWDKSVEHPLTGNFVHKDAPCTAKKIPRKAVYTTSRQSCPTATETQYKDYRGTDNFHYCKGHPWQDKGSVDLSQVIQSGVRCPIRSVSFENVNLCSHYGEQNGVSLKKKKKKLKIELLIWSSNPTLRHISRKNESSNSKRYKPPMFIAALYNGQDMEAT